MFRRCGRQRRGGVRPGVPRGKAQKRYCWARVSEAAAASKRWLRCVKVYLGQRDERSRPKAGARGLELYCRLQARGRAPAAVFAGRLRADLICLGQVRARRRAGTAAWPQRMNFASWRSLRLPPLAVFCPEPRHAPKGVLQSSQGPGEWLHRPSSPRAALLVGQRPTEVRSSCPPTAPAHMRPCRLPCEPPAPPAAHTASQPCWQRWSCTYSTRRIEF